MSAILQSQNLTNKRVLVRADLNTPNTKTAHRLASILPTLDYLRTRGAKIILATHIGRPKNQDPELSTQKLIPWFAQHHYPITFAPDLETAHQKSFTTDHTIVLLENLRFFPGEQSKNPIERTQFAQKLARLADFYVNDAFGTLHRNNTSITDLPFLFPTEKRSLGLLIIKELSQLHRLFTNPQRPFLAFFGGNKVHTKINLMKHLIPKLDTIALCPALVFSFLHYQKKSVGTSLIDTHCSDAIQEILLQAKHHKVTLLFPVDYLVADDQNNTSLYEINADHFPDNAHGISIGSKTTDAYIKKIKESKTILYNGLSGFLDKPETLRYTNEIFKAMNQSPARTVIAGGDCVAAALQADCTDSIDYVSTGGGATMAYLTDEKLPGLDAFKDQIKEII